MDPLFQEALTLRQRKNSQRRGRIWPFTGLLIAWIPGTAGERRGRKRPALDRRAGVVATANRELLEHAALWKVPAAVFTDYVGHLLITGKAIRACQIWRRVA